MKVFRLTKILVLATLLPYTWCSGQQSSSLDLERFYRLVSDYHPIANQASLIALRGSANVQLARGSFDPKIVSEYNAKDFQGKNYYDVWQSYVKIPTLLNFDFKAGYERNSGLYLNPENNVPSDGLYYAGVSVPIGQGLIRNPRTIGLKKSRFAEKDLQNEANIVLNNLFLDANHVYWWWYENYEKNLVVSRNLILIEQKYEGIREAAINGEKAAIDSVEILIQVQQWTNDLKKAELELQNSLLMLQNFIWNDSLNISGITPVYDISENNFDLSGYLDWAINHNPLLKKLSIQSSVLELDRKLSNEQLKPVVDLNYNLLLSQDNDQEQSQIFSNNYKLGVQFAFPLFIRKERAKLKIVKFKQKETDLKIDQKSREVINKIHQSYNKVFALQEMILQQIEINENYEKMLTAEQIKFDNGESSVFLLNSRENKKLKGELKLIELKAKYGRSIGELKWSAGMLYDEIRTLD